MMKQPYIRTCDRLVVYACSFGYNGAVKPNIPWKTKGGWPDLVSRHYGIPLVNCSVPGTGPDWQFDCVLGDWREGKYNRQTPQPTQIGARDCVIIQWSHYDRIAGENPQLHWMKAADKLEPIDGIDVHKAYYGYVYSQYWRHAQILAYATTIQHNLPNRVLHAFIEGTNDLAQGEWSDLLRNIDTVGPTNSIHETIVGHRHPCCHATPEGHQRIAELYIRSLDSKY